MPCTLTIGYPFKKQISLFWNLVFSPKVAPPSARPTQSLQARGHLLHLNEIWILEGTPWTQDAKLSHHQDDDIFGEYLHQDDYIYTYIYIYRMMMTFLNNILWISCAKIHIIFGYFLGCGIYPPGGCWLVANEGHRRVVSGILGGCHTQGISFGFIWCFINLFKQSPKVSGT